MSKQEKNVAIVLAAGKGSRMGTDIPKQYLNISGKPVLYYSLQTFQNAEDIDEIILVTTDDWKDYCRKKIVEAENLHKVKQIIPGGAERYDSVYQGLLACQDCDYVFVHDGARPFISQEIIKRCMDTVRESSACVVGMPTKDTIKIADQNGCIESTPMRDFVWNIQTPQVFSYDLLREAYEKIHKMETAGITDDAMVVEATMGKKIRLVKGSYENIKITTPEDIEIAEIFVKNK